MDDLVSDPQRPSVDIMVCRNHQTLFRYFTGVKDIEKNNAVTGDEFYFIYSMTKMLTCACALQLLEKGKYRLDDKLCDYLPEFAKMKIGADGINPENAAKIAGGKSIGEQVDIVGNGYAKTPITMINIIYIKILNFFNFNLIPSYFWLLYIINFVTLIEKYYK